MRSALKTLVKLLTQVVQDPGENQPVIWHGFVNGVLSSSWVPARLRTLGYRAAGLRLHHSVLMRPGVVIRDANLQVGANTTINYGTVFDNRLMVRIGARVGVGIGVQFINTEHDRSDPDRRSGQSKFAEIVVGDGASIGSRSTVLSGVTIGEGVVVAAGSVVLTDCTPHGLYAGVPARRKKDLPTGRQVAPS